MRVKLTAVNSDGHTWLRTLCSQKGVQVIERSSTFVRREVGGDYHYHAVLKMDRKTARRIGVADVVIDNVHRGYIYPMGKGYFLVPQPKAEHIRLEGHASNPQTITMVSRVFGGDGGAMILAFAPDWWEAV